MKTKLCLLILLFFSLNKSIDAEDLRGDTIAIQSYLMRLDFSDFNVKNLIGDVSIGISARMDNVRGIHLDLLRLAVDSVKINGAANAFTYNDTLLNIGFPVTLNTGDSATLEIFYHGTPEQPSGDFGGFFWGSDYAFNIGVSFLATPNNFGKAWFPCFDNFMVRSYHEYYITAPNGYVAFCNGTLLDTVKGATTSVWHWKLNENIPSYLASVTVGSFAVLKDTVNGMNGTVPIELTAFAVDTNNLKSQFRHLHEVFHNLESHWGPYRWPRVGYCLLPFDYGAMEHATNISFSRYFIDPDVPEFSDIGEQTMAHELSHHWFGDLVTTDSSAEMWLNEGWAVFNEILFFEYTYGLDSAKIQLRTKLQTVLQQGYIYDGGYFPVCNVPHDATYGNTVYQKGCNVIHTLRYYLGDSLFFPCVRSYLDTYEWGNGSTQKIQDYLSQCSGIDLSDYFNDWVKQPGFTHLSIEAANIEPSANNMYTVNYQIRQRISHANHYYNNVPVTVSYFNKDMSRVTEVVPVSGECTAHSTILPFSPVYIVPDFDENLQDAINDEWKMIYDTGAYTYTIGLMNLRVNSMNADSALVRVEHNWIPADAMYHPVQGLHLDNRRYWTFNGIFDSTFKATATINYNGTSMAYLDSGFITNSEDSLVMMYRPVQDSDWAIYDSFYVNTSGSDSNGVGTITIYDIKKGEYALAIYDSRLPTDTNTRATCAIQTGIAGVIATPDFNLFPNPAAESVTATFEGNTFSRAEIFDLTGRKILEQKISGGQVSLQIKLKPIQSGSYFVTLTDNKGNRVTKKLVKE